MLSPVDGATPTRHGARSSCTTRQRNTTAVIDTVFHDRLPAPGKIHVTPSSGLADGQTVTVAVTGYPAGAHVNAMLCAAPDATGSGRLRCAGPERAARCRSRRHGSSKLVVKEGPVGSQRIPCGRDAVCGISVASADVFTRAPVVAISFASPGGAVYNSNRVAHRSRVAIVLLGLAIWFLRRTDWSPVGEAAAPEIDDAEYADLDAIIAALPPEEDAEPARAR